MTVSKFETDGFKVHKKIKNLFKNYGIMASGLPAETLGQNQAEMSLANVSEVGNVKENIEKFVQNSDLTKPTNSCGQASNEICMLLLGTQGAQQFEKDFPYVQLLPDGTNLKNALSTSNKNILVRLEVDRFNPPVTYMKIEKENFNPNKAIRNKIYLLKDKLLYLNEVGEVIDMEKSPEECEKLFNAIKSRRYQDYYLEDDFMEPDDGEDEAAICSMNDYIKERLLDSWISSHSFTLFVPEVAENSPRKIYPYQAYWTIHDLQQWFEGNKDETLSELGIDGYINQLALLGATNNNDVRSNTYGQLFSRPGSEKTFCAPGINEKLKPLRVKFKVTEVDPELALKNIESVQQFINKEYPGENEKVQCKVYETKAKEAMTKQLKSQLMPKEPKNEPIMSVKVDQFKGTLFHKRIENSISSLIKKENLKAIAKQADSLSGIERQQVLDYFKTLPQEVLEGIRKESNMAQQVWDEQYGLVVVPSKK